MLLLASCHQQLSIRCWHRLLLVAHPRQASARSGLKTVVLCVQVHAPAPPPQIINNYLDRSQEATPALADCSCSTVCAASLCTQLASPLQPGVREVQLCHVQA